MVSLGRLKLSFKPTPFYAIYEADILTLVRSRIVLAWLIISFFIGSLIVISNPLAEAMDRIQTNLWLFVYVWSLMIIGLSAGAVSSESGVIADSLLSRSVKRYEYILAKVCSRCSVVLMVYLVVVFILSLIAVRIAQVGDLDYWGWLRAVLMVGLILVFLTILGVMFSTLSSSTVVSVILVLLTWYMMLFALPIAQLDMVSPAYLLGHSSSIMTGYWDDNLWQMAGVFPLICFFFVLIALYYFENKDLASE
jgi:hypothetical protein